MNGTYAYIQIAKWPYEAVANSSLSGMLECGDIKNIITLQSQNHSIICG